MSDRGADGADRDRWPTVSVVMPIRDEAAHVEQAVASVLAQDYPLPFDVWLAVAPSRDDTDAVVARLTAADERVRAVPNPAGSTPAGLNAAIAASAGEVVVRVDGHSELSPGYIRRAVETMRHTGAVNVGGRQVPHPEGRFEAAVAAATTSWMGTGGATYRVGGVAGSVDTVYLGVFQRAAGDAVGWFDEGLVRNQDYELNIRLRAAGGTVWFDPALWVGYRPRPAIRALARQYFEYGWWKAEVLRRHPQSARPRQLAVPLAMIAVVGGAVAAPRRPKLAVAPLTYLAAVVGTAVRTRRRDPVPVVAALVTIHAAWAAGIVAGGLRRRRGA